VATARDIDRHFTAGRYPGLAAALAGLERSGRVERVRLADGGAEWPGPWYVHADDLPLLERLQAGDVATALKELAAFLGADGVELGQPPPKVWRGAFA
jgi:hypothetical protein